MSKVLPSEWEAPDHLAISDRKFLVDRAETIGHIVTDAYFKVGQVLLQVRRKFRSDPEVEDWFPRWVAECTPFSYPKAMQLCSIVEKAEKDPRIVELTKQYPVTTMREVLSLPESLRKEFISIMETGEAVTQKDVNAVRQTPEYEVERLQELVLEMQATLIKGRLNQDKGTPREKANKKYAANQVEQRLNDMLEKLAEAKLRLESQDKIVSLQELVLKQLQKQLRQKEVQLEEMNLNPTAKRDRDIARTIVDATKGLDLILATLDKYGTDKPDLGPEAIRMIERKMDLVKTKLIEHYARTTKS
jgi:hypothetical protein